MHLNNSNKFKHVNDISYLGSRDCGIGLFESDFQFTIVTCSLIRGIKRLPNVEYFKVFKF